MFMQLFITKTGKLLLKTEEQLNELWLIQPMEYLLLLKCLSKLHKMYP